MKHLLRTGAVLLAFGPAISCHDAAKPRDLRSVSITLERTPCDGTCPAYVITLHGNGRVEYLGKARVDIPGSQTITVDPQSILDLLKTFEEIHFFDLQNRYFEDCTDLPTAIISLHVDARFKQVSNYYGGCERQTLGPQVQLARLSEQIDTVVRSERWVKCNSECVKELVQMGLNVNAGGPDGKTALLVAIQEGDFEKMGTLLDAGANLNATDQQGTTPLMEAVIRNRPQMVRELLVRGADVNFRDSKGYTALAMTGDEKLQQLLIQAGGK